MDRFNLGSTFQNDLNKLSRGATLVQSGLELVLWFQ